MRTNHEQLKSIISELSGHPADNINDDTEFVKDLHMDSLKVVELLSILSEDYNVPITEDDASSLHNYKNLYDYVQANG